MNMSRVHHAVLIIFKVILIQYGETLSRAKLNASFVFPCLLIKRIKHDIGQCMVDEEKCVGCKRCLKVACPAVTIRDKKAHIDPNQCVGCTVCAQVCPKGAISRKEN